MNNVEFLQRAGLHSISRTTVKTLTGMTYKIKDWALKHFPPELYPPEAKNVSALELPNVLEAFVKGLSGATQTTLVTSDDIISDVNLTNLVPVIDAVTGERYVCHAETLQLADIHYDVYKAKLNKEEKSMIDGFLVPIKRVYDPYTLERVKNIVHSDIAMSQINLYSPPAWRHLAAPPSLPKEIEVLWQNLFPQEEARSYALTWLVNAMLRRNETYLVLNGAKGVGKGIFCTLAKALVGRDNYDEAPTGFFDSNFSSVLENKRIIVFDEVRVDKEAHSILKRIINKFQNIEKKGVDAKKSQEIYNSYIISNNDISDMYLEVDDRRFSVPELGEKNLVAVMGQEAIAQMVSKLENDENYVAGIGEWLLNNVPEGDPVTPYLTPKFYRLAYHSLAEWQKYIISECEAAEKSGEEYVSLTVIRKKYLKTETNKFPRDTAKVESFLKNYLVEGREPIGTLERIEGDWVINVGGWL